MDFDQIKRTDDGLYTCTANNSAGTKTHKEILVVRCESEVVERLSMTLRQTANGKNETFAVCLQLFVQ